MSADASPREIAGMTETGTFQGTAGLRLLVCGGRDYADRERLFAVLDKIHTQYGVAVVIHGAARGADQLAGEWAFERSVNQIAVAANWREFGNAAGPLRNQSMLDNQKPTHVCAFPGGNGTAHMVRIASAAGLPVYKPAAAITVTPETDET